jgi:hypothetical protein
MLATIERVLRHRVAIVLTVAGVVDIATGDPAAHGIALVVVALALAVETAAERRPPGPLAGRSRAQFRPTAPMAVGAAAYAVAVGAFARFSWPLTAAVVAPGAAAVTFAWTGTPVAVPEADTTGRPSAVPWVVVMLALAAWEVQALLLQPTLTTSSWAHPTLSTLMDPVLSSHLGRSVSLAAWLGLGGYLMER